MIKPKKIFEYFICFLKCFCVKFVCLEFSKMPNLLLLKNSFKGIFASKPQDLTRENEEAIFSFF